MTLNKLNTLRYKMDYLDASQTPVLSGIAANAEDLSGRKLELAQLISAETTHRFTVRYDAQITSDGHISFDGSVFAIDYLRDPGEPFRKFYLEIYAHKVRDGK
jgi:SPP1 family predicted phage head-tail adaptor